MSNFFDRKCKKCTIIYIAFDTFVNVNKRNDKDIFTELKLLNHQNRNNECTQNNKDRCSRIS